MKIQIIQRACGGTEFLPQPSRLHLGAQNAEGVDRLQFQLPESWADCAIALYLRRSDGTQLAPVPLDGDACVTVDRRLTGCTGGQWMLAAVSGSGYTAYTRPGRYDTYATLPTDGGSEDLPPTLYEQFVARGMSKRVVDFLEPIKVDQQQGQPRAAFQCAPTGFVEHLLKHGPVRQPGQGIMACLSQSGSG